MPTSDRHIKSQDQETHHHYSLKFINIMSDQSINPEDYSKEAYLTGTEAGEPDEATDSSLTARSGDRSHEAWADRADFDAFILQLGLRYFGPAEFLVKGGSNSSGSCAGRNTDPPRNLWPKIAATARVLDELRHRLGYAIRLTSVYRSPAYNTCIGGESRSYHMIFNASDFQGAQGTPAQWRNELRAMRSAGFFSGGIGLYPTFVHVDTRGYDADW